jgi:predicted dehydrogenase
MSQAFFLNAVFHSEKTAMKNETIYTAVLTGCGRIGYSLGLDPKREQPASHTASLISNPRIQLTAGCDTDRKTLEIWEKANPAAMTFHSSKAMYGRLHPDIAVIAVNEENHKKEAIAAIKAHPRLVILEKPVALNVDEALEIKQASENEGVAILVNHERRFSADYALAKNLLSKIGRLQYIHGTLCSGMAVYTRGDKNTGACSLFHDGTHLADTILYLMENTEDENAPEIELSKPTITGIFRDNENTIRQLSSHYSSSLCPDITMTFSGRSKFFGFEIDILGTEGRIQVGNGIWKYSCRTESSLYTGFYSLEENHAIRPPKRTGYFSNMIQNAVDYLDGKAGIGSTIKNGIAALRILEEIKNQL